MKEKIAPWNIYEFLTTEEAIKGFVEASIEEAKNDTDSRCITRALATAAEARRRLSSPQGAKQNTDEIPCEETVFNQNPCLDEFDKTARSFGYHVTLAPVA